MNLTEYQRELLERIYKDGYKTIAQDEDGTMAVYKDEPEKLKKVDGQWRDSNGSITGYETILESLFKGLGIKWEDEKPFNIAKALKIIDWSKVPIDTKVYVKDKRDLRWQKMYFAGLDEAGKPATWYGGNASWTTTHKEIWQMIKLAEEE